MSSVDRVRFCLAISNGDTFQISSVTSVERVSCTLVDDFRYLVKSAFPQTLQGIEAPLLEVFTNKASLLKVEKRQNIVNRDSKKTRQQHSPEAKEHALNPWDSLEGLGTSAAQALMVVSLERPMIPFVATGSTSKRPRLSSEIVRRPPRLNWSISDFCELETPCTLPMDEWLSMTYNGMVSNLPRPFEKQTNFQHFVMDFPFLLDGEGADQVVFVRPCYENLFDLLLDRIV